ncbi:MAG TPA: hypothetical protein PLJ62_13790 [Thermoflexales bacterium]|nr:hypothetical protein [Thermoflexales bacterium]HRA01273.1 hypothetical protein [Thermoflexales bacterium]
MKKTRPIVLGILAATLACCGLGAIGAIINPSPKATPTPANAPARLAADFAPTTTARTATPAPAPSFTPEPPRTPTASPTTPAATRTLQPAPVATTAPARPTLAVTAIPTKPVIPTAALLPTRTATARPNPTATAIPAPAAPVFTQETSSRRRVDPAWWPCNEGQVKGNNKSGIYHAPGQRDYAYTFADVRCFNTEAEAQGAGFRKAQR